MLSLGDKKIGHGHVPVLADARACGALGSLQTLSLNNNKIGDEGAKALAPTIHDSASLTWFDARSNDLTADNMAALRKAVEGRSRFELLT